MSKYHVDGKRFLHIDGRKMPMKVTRDGRLEFCSKQAQHRGKPSRFLRVGPGQFARGVRQASGARPVRVDTA